MASLIHFEQSTGKILGSPFFKFLFLSQHWWSNPNDWSLLLFSPLRSMWHPLNSWSDLNKAPLFIVKSWWITIFHRKSHWITIYRPSTSHWITNFHSKIPVKSPFFRGKTWGPPRHPPVSLRLVASPTRRCCNVKKYGPRGDRECWRRDRLGNLGLLQNGFTGFQWWFNGIEWWF